MVSAIHDEARAALERSGGALGLSSHEWDNVMLFARWRSMAQGEVLFAQGEAGDSLALVVDGHFSVRVHTAGVDVEIMRLEPGEFIGEMACLDPAPRSATVVAATAARIITLDRTSLLVMCEHLPRVAARITSVIIDRVNAKLTEIDHRLDEIMGVDPSVRGHNPPQPASMTPRPSQPPARASQPPIQPTMQPAPPRPSQPATATHDPQPPPPRAVQAAPPKTDADEATSDPQPTPSWWRSIFNRVRGAG